MFVCLFRNVTIFSAENKFTQVTICHKKEIRHSIIFRMFLWHFVKLKEMLQPERGSGGEKRNIVADWITIIRNPLAHSLQRRACGQQAAMRHGHYSELKKETVHMRGKDNKEIPNIQTRQKRKQRKKYNLHIWYNINALSKLFILSNIKTMFGKK